MGTRNWSFSSSFIFFAHFRALDDLFRFIFCVIFFFFILLNNQIVTQSVFILLPKEIWRFFLKVSEAGKNDEENNGTGNDDDGQPCLPQPPPHWATSLSSLFFCVEQFNATFLFPYYFYSLRQQQLGSLCAQYNCENSSCSRFFLRIFSIAASADTQKKHLKLRYSPQSKFHLNGNIHSYSASFT